MTKKKSSLSAEAGPAVPQLLLLKSRCRRNSARAYRYALGTGLVGGIFRNNGRYTAAEECIAMGAGDLFTVMEAVATHKNMDFPGHKHATLYNIYKIEPAVKKLLLSRGIKLLMADPAVKTEYEGDTITAVITKSGLRLTADAFVDVSGSSAMPLNCNKHGNGCAMCILRCHSFGPRVSVTTQSGVEEWTAENLQGSAP